MDHKPHRLTPTDVDNQQPSSIPEKELFSLPIDEVAIRFDNAGLPRTERTLLRYCADGKLRCTKQEIPQGEKWFATENSVERLIGELKQKEAHSKPTSHGEPRSAMVGQSDKPQTDGHGQATSDRDSHGRSLSDDDKDAFICLLTDQMSVKDEQIKALLERDKETNVLIQGLQNLVLHELLPICWTDLTVI